MKTPQQVYAEQLMLRVKGHPLWIPEPSNLPSDAHRKVGIVPGDVGYLTADGDFVFLFHIFSGPGAPRQENPTPYGTPENFYPIEVPAGDGIPPIIKDLPVYTKDTCISSVTKNSADISLSSNLARPAR